MTAGDMDEFSNEITISAWIKPDGPQDGYAKIFSRRNEANDGYLFNFDYAPTPITEEIGTREPEGAEEHVMVDSALFALEELMHKYPECLLYGQDVGGRLGGVFREAATLAKKFGDHRVFNTPIHFVQFRAPKLARISMPAS